jgi:drug/metabolite transporter (DMT)-like permease
MLLAPFSAVVLGWLFLGEAPSSLLLVGGAIAIFGVYIGAVAPSAGAKSGSSTRLGN